MIRKVGNRYVLRSKTTGRKLGTFRSRKAAKKREQQIQFFKRRKQRQGK